MNSFDVPETMKAALLCEYNQNYKIDQVPTPKIRHNELLIRVHAAGYCHSDLQVYHGQFHSKLPLIPSHEPAGTIVQVGSSVGNGWKTGDRVGVLNFKNSCRQCSGCKSTQKRQGKYDPRFCHLRETAGFQHDGAFAEYLVADPETTVRLPSSLSFAQAAPLMCAGATVWGALEKASEGIVPGENVLAIIGIGGLGHLAVKFAKSMGYKGVVAIDGRREGRQLATGVADLVIDSTDSEKARDSIMEFTNGEGVAAAVVCTDSLEANNWALHLLRVGGTLVLLGLPKEKWRFDGDVIVFRELVLKGNYVASREATERMMAAVERDRIQSHLIIVPGLEGVSGVIGAYCDPSLKGRLVVEIEPE